MRRLKRFCLGSAKNKPYQHKAKYLSASPRGSEEVRIEMQLINKILSLLGLNFKIIECDFCGNKYLVELDKDEILVGYICHQCANKED